MSGLRHSHRHAAGARDHTGVAAEHGNRAAYQQQQHAPPQKQPPQDTSQPSETFRRQAADTRLAFL